MQIKKNTLWMTAGLILVIIVAYFVFANGSASKDGETDNGGNSDAQKITISYKSYNYYPQTITVKVNQPVEITLDSSVSGCFRQFVIRDFGVNKYSANPGQKITFTPDKTGTFRFACGMGMGTGTLIVE